MECGRPVNLHPVLLKYLISAVANQYKVSKYVMKNMLLYYSENYKSYLLCNGKNAINIEPAVIEKLKWFTPEIVEYAPKKFLEFIVNMIVTLDSVVLSLNENGRLTALIGTKIIATTKLPKGIPPKKNRVAEEIADALENITLIFQSCEETDVKVLNEKYYTVRCVAPLLSYHYVTRYLLEGFVLYKINSTNPDAYTYLWKEYKWATLVNPTEYSSIGDLYIIRNAIGNTCVVEDTPIQPISSIIKLYAFTAYIKRVKPTKEEIELARNYIAVRGSKTIEELYLCS